jgi:hypothetical protein
MVLAAGRFAVGAHDEEGKAKGQQHQHFFHGRPPVRSAVPHPSAQDKNSGRRLDAKAVITAMPAVKARARVMAVFFMAISLFGVLETARTGQAHP